MKDNTKTPEEALIRIFINGDFFSALLCSPRQTRELAVGWLFNQGYIESIDEVASIETYDDSRDIKVGLTSQRYKKNDQSKLIRTVACMGGEISYSQFFADRPKLSSHFKLSLPALKSLMQKNMAMASLYKETGGIHCAGVASIRENRIMECFEDVGRHNAVDKIVGYLLLNRQSYEDKTLLTSGRISSEMALKTAKAGIPIIATITTCTDLAVRIAENAGLTVVSRTLSASPVIWCGRERII